MAVHTKNKFHSSNIKENKTDIEEEWKNLQNVLKSAAYESSGKIKKTKQRKYHNKNMG
jgi:hypothetical protein